jgi:signal transduction histidine kinase
VARKVARAHGGELHLDPPDALPGTSFTLSLPRKVEASPSA